MLKIRNFLWLIFTITLFSACEDACETRQTYYYYEPVITPISEIRSSVETQAPRPIKALGKIYFKDNFLYLNEPGAGIHVIDNSNPANPIQLAFINIPGNYSLAAKGDALYANSYMDLVVLDISDPLNVIEAGRNEQIFSNYYTNDFFYRQQDEGIVTDYAFREEISVDVIDCDKIYQDDYFPYDRGFAFSSSNGANRAFSKNTMGAQAGIGGSMATFTIYANMLYAIDQSNLILTDISSLIAPAVHSKRQVGWGIETLFPYYDKLFIGAQDGMYIYDNKNPADPTFLSKYEHLQSCDPVVVQDSIAYVTLRDGNTCQGFVNQLEIIDISDLTNPKEMKTYPLYNPHGLGIDGASLFVCDGDAGLKVYDATDLFKIDQNMVKQYADIHALDVIPLQNTLMLIGDDGLYQYDYTDKHNISLLSSIKIEKSDEEN